MVLLWCAAVASFVVIVTQPGPRTWPVYSWVVASFALALVGTVMHGIGRKQRKRWDAGNYD